MQKASPPVRPDLARQSILQRHQDDERFSSYESPDHSQHNNEDFSDFETSRETDRHKEKSPTSIKINNNPVEEIPLQTQHIPSAKPQQPKPQPNMIPSPLKEQSFVNKQSSAKRQSVRQKENCSLRYNYMEKVQKQLSTIHQDVKEDLKQSSLSSQNILRSYSLLRAPSFGGLDNIRWNNEMKIYTDPNVALLQKQRFEMLMLEQENITLRERVLFLEKELRTKNQEERLKKETERLHIAAQEEQLNTTRREAKLKLVEEVAILQSRCRQMKEQMKQYRQRQEEIFNRLTKEKEEAKLEVIRLKAAHSYQAKFAEVFLNMVQKLPVDLEEGWSNKRKIAVGWKVVKHLVKKAFKLGIHPPAITQQQ